MNDAPSAYDHDSGVLSLQHTAVDSWVGVRAYNEDELDAMKFHQDTLLEPGEGPAAQVCGRVFAEVQRRHAERNFGRSRDRL